MRQSSVIRVAAVTGARADFGLLRPVLAAVDAHHKLRLDLLAAGAHLLEPARTIDEVRGVFDVAAEIPMQRDGEVGPHADAAALGRGISGLAARFAAHTPDVVLVLGDRIEAFAAAAAAAIAGIRVAHLHGGDRAQGIADEGMRHAITKLAHIHLPATDASARRIVSMGESPARVHVVGSPAIDDLEAIEPLEETQYERLGRPEVLFLLHPTGDDDRQEQQRAEESLDLCRQRGRTLALAPNHDPGRTGIAAAIAASGCPSIDHLERTQFVGLMKRADLLFGNSSAGLIEAAAVGVRAINVGPRQLGRYKPDNVIDIPIWDVTALAHAIHESPVLHRPTPHPYGEGQAGPRTAEVLANLDWEVHGVRKRNEY